MIQKNCQKEIASCEPAFVEQLTFRQLIFENISQHKQAVSAVHLCSHLPKILNGDMILPSLRLPENLS